MQRTAPHSHCHLQQSRLEHPRLGARPPLHPEPPGAGQSLHACHRKYALICRAHPGGNVASSQTLLSAAPTRHRPAAMLQVPGLPQPGAASRRQDAPEPLRGTGAQGWLASRLAPSRPSTDEVAPPQPAIAAGLRAAPHAGHPAHEPQTVQRSRSSAAQPPLAGSATPHGSSATEWVPRNYPRSPQLPHATWTPLPALPLAPVRAGLPLPRSGYARLRRPR
mmetsp:Transcript_78191/g.229155  ORF Transcript_78191/g.229155 Transcript_78191/m.229155 type:complete len:221 (-) Transcript_78191:2176-2838(-)